MPTKQTEIVFFSTNMHRDYPFSSPSPRIHFCPQTTSSCQQLNLYRCQTWSFRLHDVRHVIFNYFTTIQSNWSRQRPSLHDRQVRTRPETIGSHSRTLEQFWKHSANGCSTVLRRTFWFQRITAQSIEPWLAMRSASSFRRETSTIPTISAVSTACRETLCGRAAPTVEREIVRACVRERLKCTQGSQWDDESNYFSVTQAHRAR